MMQARAKNALLGAIVADAATMVRFVLHIRVFLMTTNHKSREKNAGRKKESTQQQDF